MLAFVIIIAVSTVICCAVFIIAQAMALRKSISNPEVAIVRNEPDRPPPPDQEATHLASVRRVPPETRASRNRKRAAPGTSSAANLDEARTEIRPSRSETRNDRRPAKKDGS